MEQVTFCPPAVAAGTGIDLPPGTPKIDAVISATLFRGSDGTVSAAEVAATATKIDEDTISLNVDTTTRDLLTLRYIVVGVRGPKPF